MDPRRSLGFLLKSVTKLYVQRFEQRARGLGLTLPQSKALVYLDENEGISQTQLGELIDVEPMNLVRILDRMEGDGWLERRPDPADRRARRLFLKPKARPLLEQIWELTDLTRAEAVAGFPPHEVDLLIHLLARIHGNLGSLGAASLPPPAERAAAASGPNPVTARGAAEPEAAK